MNLKKIVVDSGIIAEHLTTAKSESLLRQLSRRYFCYTTVFNAIELFAAARSQKETEAIQQAMDALKVLGISPKSAKNIAAAVSASKMDLAALAAGVCIECRVPMVTLQPKRFLRMKKLEVYSVHSLLQ